MASRRTRPRLILAALLLAIGLAVWWWGPWAWRELTTRRVPIRESFARYATHIDGHPIVGFATVKRWDPDVRHGKLEVYFVETGLKFEECEYRDGWGPLRYTTWNYDGTVKHQRRYIDDAGEVLLGGQEGRGSPPWWWTVADQTGPTLPHWLRAWDESGAEGQDASGR